MFKPVFHYTPKMVNELGKIERLYGQLLGEKLIPSLALKLSQENQMLATHHSTSIEGNPLSPRDVTNIVLGSAIPTTKSEKEVKNYFTVLNTIFVLANKREPITTLLTGRLQLELMKGIEEEKLLGRFRDGPVFVGHKTREEIVVKHNPPYHTEHEIANALIALYDWLSHSEELHPLIRAGILHHQFAYIHPFFDGNGRLARILSAYYLLLAHYDVVKYFILDDYYDIDRQLYSDKLHSADSPRIARESGEAGRGDTTAWLEYFLEGIAYSLQAALVRIEKAKSKNLDDVTGDKRVLVTSREEDVLRIVLEKKAIKTSDIQDALSVTRQQAHALLFSLVKKGLMSKFGKTKTSYYTLLKNEAEKI